MKVDYSVEKIAVEDMPFGTVFVDRTVRNRCPFFMKIGVPMANNDLEDVSCDECGYQVEGRSTVVNLETGELSTFGHNYMAEVVDAVVKMPTSNNELSYRRTNEA